MEKTIKCLIWPELNDYTGKSKTIAQFTNEKGVAIDDFLEKVSKFWNDLKNWIVSSNKNADSLSTNLELWFSFELKELKESEIEKLVEGDQSENTSAPKYQVKKYIIKNDETDDFNWKRFSTYARKYLEENIKLKKEKDLDTAMNIIADAFFGPVCDTFRQDYTNNVPVDHILPTKHMISSLFANAVKFVNSPTATEKIEKKWTVIASEVLENYQKVPSSSVVEVKQE